MARSPTVRSLSTPTAEAVKGGVVSLGVIIPNSGSTPGSLGLLRMAVEAERAGAQGLWFSDHLVMVDVPVDNYPYSDDGHLTWDVNDDYFESLICCSAVAAVTERAVIGSAILVLPQRNVLQVAKEAASLDVLSGGRFVLGVGSGWNGPEMEALGYPFQGRTRRFEEQLDVLRSSWNGRPAAYEGSQVRVREGLALFPTPTHETGVPLLVGGMGRPAIGRAARVGGWMAIAAVHRWDLEAMLVSMKSYVRDCAEAGMRARAALKLHCLPDNLKALPDVLDQAFNVLRFAHVIVEPPWSHGMAAATDMIARLDSYRSCDEARDWLRN